MKHFLHAFLIFAFCFPFTASQAQVTKLSNNTNLEIAIPLGNIAVLISKSDSLWRTDGTPGGTFKYANNVSIDSLRSYIAVGNKIYFSGKDANGTELWVTDGTAAGTKMLKNIHPTGSSRPRYFTTLNNTVFFFANNGTDSTELWKTDGTEIGTSMVKNINPTGSSLPAFTIPFPPPFPSFTIELGGQYFTKNNFLYFTADNGTDGVEIWKTDGTELGTTMLTDINTAGSSYPQGFYQYGSVYLFSAYTPDNGRSLWKTDGTSGGTTLVKEFDPTDATTPAYSPAVIGFTTFNNKVYFDARDPDHGMEGWVTDGTTIGTTLLKDFNADTEDGFPLFADALFFNNKLIFPATSANEGTELWTSDGTTANTTLFKDINTGTPDSDPFIQLNGFGVTDINAYHSNLYKGFLFMTATTPDAGTELWKTDGTANGTVRVKDINPGTDSSMGNGRGFFSFYSANGYYFTANDGTHGEELWKSDGTEPNTNMVIDIFPTTDSSSSPQSVGYFNGIVLFSAHDGDNAAGNRDLFRLDGNFSPLPVKLLQFGGTPVDKSVQLNWTTTAEINTDYFSVERSVDGSKFDAVAKVGSQKNTAARKEYNYTDQNALDNGGKLYYRLKMVDNDGKFTYSKIIVVNKQSQMKLVTYPNPVRNDLTIAVNTGIRKQVALKIVDAVGKQVYGQQLSGMQGSNNYFIPVASFARGTYYVSLVTDDGIETTTFIKE